MTELTERAQGSIDDYLRSLRSALGGLPRSRRNDIMTEVRGHLRFALAEIPQPTEADVLNILERLGDPADIAAEALAGRPAPSRMGTRETMVLVLLPLSMIIPIIAWMVAVVLLWTSAAWSRKDKVVCSLLTLPVGTFIIALLPLVFVVHSSGSCSGDASGVVTCTSTSDGPSGLVAVAAQVAALVFWLVVPIVTTFYLGYRVRHSSPRPARITRRPTLAV